MIPHDPRGQPDRAVRGSSTRYPLRVQTLIAEILAAWRRAERLAATLPEDSREQRAALVAVGRLQILYQDLTKVAGEVDETTARELLADLSMTSRNPTGGEPL